MIISAECVAPYQNVSLRQRKRRWRGSVCREQQRAVSSLDKWSSPSPRIALKKTLSVFHHQWFKQVKAEALPSFNAFWQYLLSEGCLGLTPAEVSRHPSSYSQFVTGPEIVAAVYEIKLPQVKVNGSDKGSDFRKESLRLLRHPAVETEVYACISIFMGCPELHEYKYHLHRGRTRRKRRPRKLPGFRSKYASWQRVYSHGLPGGGVCVQTGSAGIAERPNLNPEWIRGLLSCLFSTFQLCHLLKLLSAKSPKQTNPFMFWFIYL